MAVLDVAKLGALLDTYLASSKMVRAFGASAGDPLTFDFGEPPTPTIHGHLNVSINGFGLHAATEVEADDRDRLIKLCRYVQRPTLAADRRWCISPNSVEEFN